MVVAANPYGGRGAVQVQTYKGRLKQRQSGRNGMPQAALAAIPPLA
jgi:hypothetical protein